MCSFVTLSFWSLLFLMGENFSAQIYQHDLAVASRRSKGTVKIRAFFGASVTPSVDLGGSGFGPPMTFSCLPRFFDMKREHVFSLLWKVPCK